jgi:hypothetical protein
LELIRIAVDPGVTTGLARQIIRPGQPRDTLTAQTQKPVDAWDWIALQVRGYNVQLPGQLLVLVERFNSSGALTKDGQRTIELAGFFYWCCRASNIPVQMVEASQRLSGLEQARVIGGKDHDKRHGVDALAHIIAYTRKEKEKAHG